MYQFETIEHYANQIFELNISDTNMKCLSISAFSKLLLIECNNVCCIYPIEMYVDTTPDYLNRTFKAKTGNTAKDYIQSRIITQVKKCSAFLI